MPYHVSGWLESNFATPLERHSTWEPLLSLGPFGLCGDEISNYLFGLAKSPSADAPFKGRGVPPDCSDVVRTYVETNERFIAEHGEGDFGYTYASWGEVSRALATAMAPRPDDDEPVGWKALLESVTFLGSRINANEGPFEQLRLIVWANW